jgi:HK97 gp10 family phage protein
MAVKLRIENAGFRDLEAALGDLGTLYRRKRAAQDALMEAAEIVLDAAQANVPVRGERKTFGVGGELRQGEGRRRFRVGGESRERRFGALKMHLNIGTRLNKNQRRRNAGKMPVEVYVGTRDRAGILTEFGTSTTPAQGWFRRAWDSANPRQLIEVIKDALWRQISRQMAAQERKAARLAARSAR